MIRTKLILTLAFILIGVFSRGQVALATEKLSAEVMTSHTKVTAGQEFVLTVRVIDGSGRPVPFIGVVILSTSDLRSTIPGTIVEFGGDKEFEVRVKLGTAGNQKIVATAYEEVGGDESLKRRIGTDGVTIEVSAAEPSQLSIKAQSAVEAGSDLTVNVVSQDEFGNFSPVNTTAEARIGSVSAAFTIKKGRGTVTLAPTLAGLLQLEVATLSAPPQFGSRLVEVVSSEAAKLVLWSGDGQVVDRGKTLEALFAVVVTDRFGNPVAGVAVRFSVESGGVRFGDAAPDGKDESSATSDGEGIAESAQTKAHTLGKFTVVAAIDNVPSVTFSGEVVQRVDRFSFVGLPSVVVAGESLRAVEVHAVDHLGDLVRTFTGTTSVEFSGTDAPNGTASFPSEIVLSFVAGKASFVGATFARAGQGESSVRHPTRLEISTTQLLTVLAATKVGLQADQTSVFADTGKSVPLSGSIIDRFGNTVPEGGVSVLLELAEIDEIPGRFVVGPTHNTRRLGAMVARLGNGRVMIVGGEDELATPILPTIVYHPTTHTFHPGPSLLGHRKGHSATSLPDGGVLIFGGAGFGVPVAERYDPVAKLFTAVAGPVNRTDHTATSLPDGRVLIAGGLVAGAATSETLIFDPSTGLFGAGPPLPGPLVKHQALALPGGVLLLGGTDGEGAASRAILHYIAVTGELKEVGGLLTARSGFEAVLLDDSTVLVWGGETAFLAPLKDGELIDLFSGTATSVGEISESLTGARLSRLSLGKAILTGGAITTGFPPEGQATTLSYLFSKSGGIFKAGPPMIQPRFDHLAFPSRPDSGEIVLFCGGPVASEFYVSTASLKGAFDAGAKTKTVETASDGRFSFVLHVGQGKHKILATSASLEETVFVVEGETVPHQLVSLGFAGLPATVAGGESFTGSLLTKGASGEPVAYTGLAEVTLKGAGPFPGSLLVQIVGGTASLGEIKLALAGGQVFEARLLDASSVLGFSAAIEVLASAARSLRLVSGADQDVLPTSRPGLPVIVEVLDRFGNPVPGSTVTVSADRGRIGGSSTAEASSDGAGRVTVTSYVAPPDAGADMIRLSLSAIEGSEVEVPVTVTSSVDPDKLTAVSAVYSGLLGAEVEVSFRATSVGRPVGGFQVTFQITSGEATLGSTSALTDSLGIATAKVSSATFGRVTIEAVTGSHVAHADALFAPAGVPVSVSIEVSETVEAGSPFSLILNLTDANGSLVSGDHLINIHLTGATSPNGTAFPDSIDVLVSDGIATVDGLVVGDLESTIEVSHVGEVKSPPLPLLISGLLKLLKLLAFSGTPDRVLMKGKPLVSALPGQLLVDPRETHKHLARDFKVRVIDAIGLSVRNEDVFFEFVDGDSYFDETRVIWATVSTGKGGLAVPPAIRVGQFLGRHNLWAGAGPDRKTLSIIVNHRVLELKPHLQPFTLTESEVNFSRVYSLDTGMPGEILDRAAAGRSPHMQMSLIEKALDGPGKPVPGLRVEYTVLATHMIHKDHRKTFDINHGAFQRTATFYRANVSLPSAAEVPAPVDPQTIIPLTGTGPGFGFDAPFDFGEDVGQISPVPVPLLRQFEELGPRAVVRTDEAGLVGGELLLRLPREMEEIREWHVQIRVRVLPGLGRVDPESTPQAVSIYPAIYLIVKIKPPVIVPRIIRPLPLAFIAGSPNAPQGPDEVSEVGYFDYSLLTEKGDFYPNQRLYVRFFRVEEGVAGGKRKLTLADKHFFVNWREHTTKTGFGESNLVFLPKRTAPGGDYEVIVSTSPDEDPDKTLPTEPHRFSIRVKREFDVGLVRNRFPGPTMIQEGAFQRRNLDETFSGTPGEGLPTQLKLDFVNSRVVAKAFAVGETNLTNFYDRVTRTSVTKPLDPKAKRFIGPLSHARVWFGTRWRAAVHEKPQPAVNGVVPLPRVRVEKIIGLSDYRARILQSRGGKLVPVKGPLFASEAVLPGSPVGGHRENEFFIEVTAGHLGESPQLALQGLPYQEVRRSESPSLMGTEFAPSTYFESMSSFLRRFGISKSLRDVSHRTKDESKEGEVVYRFGPFRLINQLLASIKDHKEPKDLGAIQFLQVGRGLLYHLRAKKKTGERPLLPDFSTMAHGVRSFRLYGSDGARNIPSARDFVPQITLVSKSRIEGELRLFLKLQISDLFADVVGKHTRTVPKRVYVKTVQGPITTRRNFEIVYSKLPPEPGRPHRLLGTSKIQVLFPNLVELTTVSVTVTNKLGTAGELVFQLTKERDKEGNFTNKLKVEVTRRCRVTNPSIYYAAYEPPGVKKLPGDPEMGEERDSTAAPHKFFASVQNIDNSSPVVKDIELTRRASEREYRSLPLLLMRVPRLTKGLLDLFKGLPVVPVSSRMERIQLASTRLPLLTVGVKYTSTISSRPVPELFVLNDEGDPNRWVADDGVRDGDRFQVLYRPDFRAGPASTIGKTVEVVVGVRLPDGTIDSGHSIQLTLKQQANGSYRSDDDVIVTTGFGERGAMTLRLADTSAQLKIEIVARNEEFELPVVAEIHRIGGATNPAEANSGRSPQVGVGIYVHNQEQVFRLPLHQVPGRGLDYQFSLTHRTRIRTTSSVGASWTHNYDLRLRRLKGAIDFYNGDARFITFTAQGSEYEPEPGAYLALIKEAVGYAIVSPDKTKIVFGPKEVGGFLLADRIEDSNGNTITFHYDAQGRLAHVRDTFGRSYFYRYDKHGLLREVVDFLGRRFKFERFGVTITDLSGIVFPKIRSGLDRDLVLHDRAFVSFRYDLAHRLTHYTDRRLKLLFNNRFSSDGILRAQTLADGSGVGLFRLGAGSGGEIVSVVNNRGGETKYTMGKTSLKATLAEAVEVQATSSQWLKTSISYTSQGEIEKITLPRKNQVSYTYDDAALSPPRSRGNLKSITRTAASSMSGPGLLAMSGYPGFLGEITAHFVALEGAGREKDSGEPVIRAKSLVTLLKYNTKFNKVRRVELPDGSVTTSKYDTRGNLERRSHPNVKVTVVGPKGGVSSVLKSHIEKWFYNLAGQVVVYRNDGEKRERHYFYYQTRLSGSSGDDLARVLVGGKPNIPLGSSGDLLTGGTSAIGKIGGGYLAKVEDNRLGNQRWFEKDERDNTLALIDERSVVHRFKYNALDSATESRPADAWVGKAKNDWGLTGDSFKQTMRPVITFLHDAAGNRTKTTTKRRGAKKGFTIKLRLDSLGRIQRKFVPLKGVHVAETVFLRDHAGNVRSITDPKRDTVTMVHDLANRRINVISGSDNMGIEYDANGNIISRGYQAGVKRKELFFYDGHDRLIAVINPRGAVTLRTPDSLNRLKRTVVIGLGHEFRRDLLSQGVEVNFLIKPLTTLSWQERVYNKRGWLTVVRRKVTPASGKSPFVTRQLGYSTLGELVSDTRGLVASPSKASRVTRTYLKGRVNHVFNRTAIVDEETSTEIVLDYDLAGNVLSRKEMLREKSGKKLVSYLTRQRFDGLGQRSLIEQPGREPDEKRRTSFIYDERGNRVGVSGPIESRTFKFDLANRLTHVFRKDIALSTIAYYKDGMVKSRKDARGAVTTYFYRPDKKLSLTGYADGTTSAATYSDAGKLDTTTDQNGTVLKFKVDDAGQVTKRWVDRDGLGANVLLVKSQRFIRDGLGRMIQTHEGGDSRGIDKTSSEFWAYDGLGRITAQGHSVFDDADYVKLRFPTRIDSANRGVIEGFPSAVHRMVVTRWEDKSNQRVVTYLSNGLKIVHTSSQGGLHNTWEEATLKDGLGSAVGRMPDGRVKFVHHGTRGGTDVIASKATFTYAPTKQLLRFGGSVGKNFRKYTRVYLANGLLDSTTWSDNLASGSSKLEYLPKSDGRPLLAKVTEITNGKTRFPFSKRTVNRGGASPDGGMTYDLLDNQLTVKVETTTNQLVDEHDLVLEKKKGLRLRAVEKVRTTDVDRTGGINSMNRLKTFQSSLQEVKATATLVYNPAGYLTSYTENAENRHKSYKLVWDAYGRLRRVTLRSTEDVTVVMDVIERGGSSLERTAVNRAQTRNTDSYFWYSASGRRLFKYSDLFVKIAISGKNSKNLSETFLTETVRQHKGEWYTHGGGSVVEEFSDLTEVGGTRFKRREIRVQRQFIGHGKQHDAMIRRDLPVDFGPIDGGGFIPRKNGKHYIVRDENGSARLLVQPQGEPEASYSADSVGEVQEPVSISAEPTLWEDGKALNYHYSYRGNKRDIETGFVLVGARYYWPELGRFLSVDQMGAWFDPNANGNGYAYAANNPSRFSEDGSLGNLAAGALVGGLIGGTVGLSVGIYNYLFNGASGDDVLLSAGVGLIGGAVFGATFGAFGATTLSGLFGAGAVAGAAEGAVIGGVDGYLRGSALEGAAEGAAIGALFGALTAPLGGGAGACFVAGTLVQTKGGFKAVEKIEAGDWVWSRDDKTGEQGYKRVKRTFVSHPKELVTMIARPCTRARGKRSPRRSASRTTSGGDDDGSGSTEGSEADAAGPEKVRAIEITGTPEHPFWSVTRGCWITLGELRIGERLSLSNGREAVVESLRSRKAPAGKQFTTYNFEVADWHTYFVGSPAAGWAWVHNTCLKAEIASLRNMGQNVRQRAVQLLHARINDRAARGAATRGGGGFRTADDVVAAIEHNVDVAVRLTRRAAARGRISGSPQAFGSRAHKLQQRLNRRLANRLEQQGSRFTVSPEEFRVAGLADPVSRGTRGSIGADVVLRSLDDPGLIRVFDLKTHGGVLRFISPARQQRFLSRFGAQAEEIFRLR